jgi:hypothetical protein
MKIGRLAAIAIVLMLALSLSGCYDSLYFFSFSQEQDTGNEEGDWIIQGDVTHGINEYGLYINGDWVAAPLMFRGDFEITANFWLGVTAEKPGGISFVLSNIPFYGPVTDRVWISMEGLGTENEGFYVDDAHDTDIQYHYDELGQIAGLNRGHWNAMILTKKGNNIKVKLNGRTIANFDLVYYAAEYFTVNFSSNSDPEQDPADPSLGFILKDVKVEYMEGNSAPVIM